MSSITWTDEQLNAINTRGVDLLVSAAAGSGKTAVLVERIVRRLLDEREPVDLDRLLVVTFTDAAAAEMRQRVGDALVRVLQERPDSHLLKRQLFLVPRASIGTLHSFCSEVVRHHFYLLGLDPGFRVMDENEAALLRREVLEDVLEECYGERVDAPPDDPFIYLTRVLSDRHGDDRQLVALVLRLYDFSRSLPRPRAWLERVAASLAQSPGLPWEKQPWYGDWLEMIRLELESWLDALAEALHLAAGPGGPKRYVPVLEGDLARVRGWLERVGGDFSTLKQALEGGQRWPNLPASPRGEALEEIKERVQGLRNGVKKALPPLINKYFSRSPEEMLQDLFRLAPLVRSLVELVRRFDDAYRQAKRERAVADFADLEYDALAILAVNGEGSPWGMDAGTDPDAPLRPSPVAMEYRQRFVEVLVDEYQDINGVQEALLELVSRGGNRFFVGDVKQSIYRFRLADPMVFLKRYHEFADLGDGSCTGPGRRTMLSANFRSRRDILETVNYLFGRLMTRRVGEMDYDEKARLNAGAVVPDVASGRAGGPVEIHLLEYKPPENAPSGGPGVDAAASSGTEGGEQNGAAGEDDRQQVEELDLVRLEARWVAERVRRLVNEDFPVYDRGRKEYRKATWRDVVVLMRSLKGRVGVFLEEFRRLDVPAYAGGSGGYFDAPEVQTVLALLQAVDNPRRDIPLAAVLRSPMVGLKGAELAAIRLACPQGDFYTAVEQAARGGGGVDPQLAGKLDRFLARLEGWRDLARRLPPAELLEELYRQTGYYHLVGAMPGGAVRQANLRSLVDRARSFEGTIYRGLFRFLRFIEQLQEEGQDMDTARSLGENEDVVRIMSVHRSKGLEFPVVVVAGLGRRFNLMDLSQEFLLHRRLGIGPTVVDLEQGIRYPTVLHGVIRQRLRLEALAEEMRLLYVALTRAREKLILVAAARDPGRQVEQWRSRTAAAPPEGPLSVSLLAGAGCFLDWLGPALWSHPALHGLAFPGDQAVAAGSRSWQVHLWPAPALERLWLADAGGEKGEEPYWLKQLAEMKPLPEEWLARQEEGRAEDGRELITTDELRRRLFWTCPHRELSTLPSKVTVTEWRRRMEELAEHGGEEPPGERWPEAVFQGGGLEPRGEGAAAARSGDTAGRPAGAAPPDLPGGNGVFEPAAASQVGFPEELPPGFDLPAFYAGQSLSGADRGRVVHLVMQLLPLDGPLDEGEIRRQLDRLVEKEILRPEERRLVDAAAIARFWRTDLGRRALAAAREGRLWREVPFTLGLPVPDLYPEMAGKVPPEETILLQGVMDLLLVEGDGLVIVDYKTDWLTGQDLDEGVNRYRIQLNLYARAAGKLLGRPVKEKYLYFFSLNRAVAV
ncbi:UvrD-helicase domain-containing protein [Desulfofundulus thermobenzoicus]|uniref:UvrD-helicase domain-containing protein n=1 Tax=Desulfofundulus thermobenzoicus TaxID=29376 RepID=UPI001883AE4B|nr:UvrD-helicase domain-containing protein [Desulfofundulus thermobenzoicus]